MKLYTHTHTHTDNILKNNIQKNCFCKQGISLIALIITIIVIIILAAIVVGGALNTPERANWAKFTSDYSNIQQMIGIKQTELYGKYAMGQIETDDGRIPTRAEIYQAIAKGELPQSGLVNDMNEIEFQGNTILNINEPKYEGKWFLSSTGKLSYEGYKYNGTTWTTPTQEGQITGEMIAANGNYNETAGVNSPKLTEGMIPIYYDGTNWRKADATNELAVAGNENSRWYEYTTAKMQYANICTVSDEKSSYRTADVNTVIPIENMTTMFVWIPRYAYSINVGGYKTTNTESPTTTNGKASKIDVIFLVGTLNQDSTGTTYVRDYNLDSINPGDPTPPIVHPGFTFGGKELPGLWIAKFEASGKKDGVYVGNSNGTAAGQAKVPDINTYVEILPGAISWRYLTVGECQYRSMQMAGNKTEYGWSNVNTHLIKNNEWGVAAYLAYSQYGKVPMINGSGSYNATVGYYDMYTGMGPRTESTEGRYGADLTDVTNPPAREYNIGVGIHASTTGNVYGIYDMSGGAYEYVAAYLDNKNSRLNDYGKSTTTPVIYYFAGEELNTSYAEYWYRYEVSSEERNNQIDVGDGVIKTQADLWVEDATRAGWNEARWRITKNTYDNLPKGIGVSEISSNFSYFGLNETTYKFQWRLKTLTGDTAGYGISWNSDYALIGHARRAFSLRGGGSSDSGSAGVLCAGSYEGSSSYYYGFRPVVAPIQM